MEAYAFGIGLTRGFFITLRHQYLRQNVRT
jgi:hypothetical protein